MQVRHIELAASGQLQPNPSNQPIRGGDDPVNVYVTGLNNNGFTSVKLHDGIDATGPVVVAATNAGVTSWNYEIRFVNGCYVEVVGTGTVSVWVA